MSIFAVGVHTKLVNQGVSPRSEDYYEKLNARMRQVFPEEFGLNGKQTDATPPPAKKSNVAPATRSTAPKKIVLTQTQVNIAKRLGVPLELYARKVAEEQARTN
jgi:Tat protein secretion system quality control protein TatD with DNase activity